MITFEYNSDKDILETLFKDMITPVDIYEFMQHINVHEQLPRKLKVMIDVRDADFVFEPSAIQSIVKANFRMNRSFISIKNAILANNPSDATLTLFHHYTKGSKNYRVQIFNQAADAEKWLEINN